MDPEVLRGLVPQPDTATRPLRPGTIRRDRDPTGMAISYRFFKVFRSFLSVSRRIHSEFIAVCSYEVVVHQK
jgi:hypothetical protein